MSSIPTISKRDGATAVRRERKTLPSERGYGPRFVEWIKSDWFCLQCGRRDVWQAADEGSDYYHDKCVTCHTCAHTMCCVGDVTEDCP